MPTILVLETKYYKSIGMQCENMRRHLLISVGLVLVTEI